MNALNHYYLKYYFVLFLNFFLFVYITYFEDYLFLKLINNQNFPDSEMEPKSSKKLNKKLKIKEGLNTMIANLDVTVDENVVDFDNETLLRGSKDVGEFSGKKPPVIVPITNIIN